MLSLSDANQSEVIEAFTSTSRYLDDLLKSRKQNPQKLTHLSPRSHPRHLVGKRTAQKDAIKDINSQVNSYSHTGGHRIV